MLDISMHPWYIVQHPISDKIKSNTIMISDIEKFDETSILRAY